MTKFFRKIRYNLVEKNKTKKYFKYANEGITVSLIFILFIVSCSNKIYTDLKYFDCDKTIDFKADNDKKQLIYAILERAVVSKKDIPDYRLLKDKNNIYVSNMSYSEFSSGLYSNSQENSIDPKEVPTEIIGVRFCVKSKMEIQTIADKTGDFLFLTLGNIKIDGASAKIGLSNNWVLSKKNKGKYALLSGGGYILTFNKVNGDWVFDKTAPILSWQS